MFVYIGAKKTRLKYQKYITLANKMKHETLQDKNFFI